MPHTLLLSVSNKVLRCLTYLYYSCFISFLRRLSSSILYLPSLSFNFLQLLSLTFPHSPSPFCTFLHLLPFIDFHLLSFIFRHFPLPSYLYLPSPSFINRFSSSFLHYPSPSFTFLHLSFLSSPSFLSAPSFLPSFFYFFINLCHLFFSSFICTSTSLLPSFLPSLSSSLLLFSLLHFPSLSFTFLYLPAPSFTYLPSLFFTFLPINHHHFLRLVVVIALSKCTAGRRVTKDVGRSRKYVNILVGWRMPYIDGPTTGRLGRKKSTMVTHCRTV